MSRDEEDLRSVGFRSQDDHNQYVIGSLRDENKKLREEIKRLREKISVRDAHIDSLKDDVQRLREELAARLYRSIKEKRDE